MSRSHCHPFENQHVQRHTGHRQGVQCHGACGPAFALGQRWLAYNVAPHEVNSFGPSRDADVQRGRPRWDDMA